MASRNFPEGEKSNLRDLLDGYGTPAELYKYTGVRPPATPSTRVIKSTEYAATPRKRVRPGLGAPGIERIQEALAEFREEPPEEPPSKDSTEDEKLPPPEYKGPVLQSTKGTRATTRPDKYSEYWGDGSQRSTRVAAAQWIPLRYKEGELYGDILVAFARPSGAVKSSLVVYRGKSIVEWIGFRDNESLGVAVKELEPVSTVTDDDIETYKDLHTVTPDGGWIFEKSWAAVRPGNSRRVEGVSDVETLKKAKEKSKPASITDIIKF